MIMLRKVLYIFIPALLTAATASAFSVKGTIAGADGQPCPGATFRIFLYPDTVKTNIVRSSDENGNFSHTLKKAGRYRLVSSYLGYKEHGVDFRLTASKPDVDLDTIFLPSDAATLGEVVISRQRKLVESDGAKLTYNVSEDPEAQSNTILELLRRVPMVTVDAEDNIKVKGQSNFKIYLNGKEDPMLSGDIKTVLKSIPSTSIKKIEVITEPGAKYDAEGVGGILNIITDQKRTIEGYNGSANLWLNNRRVGGGVYARTKIRNVTASISVNYNNGDWAKVRSHGEGVVENLQSDEERFMRTKSSRYNTNRWLGGNINLSWEPDTLNLFTLSANYGNSRYGGVGESSTTMSSIDNVLKWGYDACDNSTYRYHNFGLQLSYQHTFGKENHTLTGSYILDNGSDDNVTVQSRENVFGITLPYLYGEQYNEIGNHRHTAQIDYVLPVNKSNTFEAGLKGNWNKSDNDSRPYYGTSAADMTLSGKERVKSEQIRDIMAGYLTWRTNLRKFTVNAGLRYEHTRMGMRYHIGDYSDFTRHLNDVIPNAALTFRFNDTDNLRLSYQMRIYRPSIEYLNPYRNEMNVAQVSYGNPNLESEKYNSVGLKFSSWRGGKLGGEVSLSYSTTHNSIEQYQFMENGIRHITYANIGRVQHTSLSGYINWNIIRDMNFSVYAEGSYRDLRSESELLKAGNSGWIGNFNINYNYRLPFGLRVSAYGGGGSKWISLQDSGSGWYYYGLGITKGFLKDDALQVSLNAQQFIPYQRTYRNTIVAENMVERTSYTYKQWSASLSVSWRFGSLKAVERKTAARIEDTNQRSGGGGNNGGGVN